jgi:probable rRNA maturation factor
MPPIDVQVAEGTDAPEALICLAVSASASALAGAMAEASLVGLAGAGEKSLTIVLAGDSELVRLNREYLGVEGPTDVLAFAHEGSVPGAPDDMADYLGDVIISLDRAAEQARAAGHDLWREVATLAAHGTLHLAGYDHADDLERQAMWALQDRAVADAAGTALP